MTATVFMATLSLDFMQHMLYNKSLYNPSMPRVVDHEARRSEVAAVAADLIARRGLEGVSVRDVAAAGG